MEYQIDTYNLLIAFGTFQSLVFGAILIRKSSFAEAHKYLGICVLFLSSYLLWVLKDSFGLNESIREFIHIPLLFLWGIGPAFYIYLRFYFRKPLSSKQVKWSFLPLIIELAYFNSKTFIGWLNDWNFHAMNTFEQNWVQSVLPVEHYIGLISIAIYLYMSLRLLQNQPKSTVNKKIFYILICFSLIWLIWLPYTIVDSVYYNFNFPVSEFYLFYILFTALTYGIGFIGFRLNAQIASVNNFESSAELQELARIIDQKMSKEKYYLNPELNIIDFSKELDLHPNKVSSILNNIMKQSFRDYVNVYRVNEFKMRLNDYDLKNHTIISLAYNVGFNSKASFHRVFKKDVGLSPIEYLEKLNKTGLKTYNEPL